jgi:opacity protein-like surface antigen
VKIVLVERLEVFRSSRHKQTTNNERKMKCLKIFTTTTLIAIALATTTRAQERWDDPLKGFYVNANAGVNIMPDVTSSSGGVTGKFNMNVGERVGASVGYMVPLASKTSIGLEFEVGALVNTLNKVSASSGGITESADLEGYYYQLPFLVNAVLVCHAVPKWAFFVGAGGGGVYSRLHVHRVNDVEVDSDSDETDGGIQAFGGARYQITPSSEVGLAYKYLAVFVNDADTVSNHAVVATYTFHF